MKKQKLWIVGGGEVFTSREKYIEWFLSQPFERTSNGSWKKWLADGLLSTHDTTRIPMPDPTNADYEVWKITFEHFFRTFENKAEELSLIGHSLGGIFLAKYLSENTLPANIVALHLVAPVWTYPESLLHNTGTFSFEPKKLGNISKQVKNIHIWVSKDDEIVNPEDSEKYHENLVGSTLHTFKNKGHFIDSHFLELFETFISR